MNVTLCAPFRDSEAILHAFIQQVNALDYPAARLRFVTVEGDSKDRTLLGLTTWQQLDNRVTLLKCDTGTPQYGSIVHPERFATLAQVFNTALNAVDLAWSDYVLFTPSDVHFKRGVLTRLLAHGKDVISPFFWGRDGLYHDTWAFTRDGQEFGKFGRDEVSTRFGYAPIEMDTIGGMMLMSVDVLRAGCRYTAEEVDRGLCKAARANGFSVWADPTTHITHL
jgi:hypothetical protein